ncbi:MAG: hypothetical protein K9M84_06910 [Spirochaetia bacterium]|nr:hypothetical protein [Spirochaetia bacterium]
MNKKFLVVLMALLLIMPATMFAADLIGFRIGPTAMLNGTLNPDVEDWGLDLENLSVEDFTFGADARLNFSLIEVNALALVTPEGEDMASGTIDLYANAGVSISLLNLLRFGVSAGPMFEIAYGEAADVSETDPMEANLNLRMTADLLLGDFSIGATGIITSSSSINDVIDGTAEFGGLFESPDIKAGVSALFAIF